MNILVPLKDENQIESYVNAGADELYVGFYDNEWEKKFGIYADLNRMSALKNKANVHSIDTINLVIESVKSHKTKCFVTLNANVYSNEQTVYIDRYLKTLEKSNPDGIIVSSPQLIRNILDHGMEPVASTMCAIYNTEAVKFYYDLGVKRMILPRELSLAEIKEIVEQYPDIEFEVFLMRNGCVFSDSNCLCIHKKTFGGICHSLRECQYEIHAADESFNNIYEIQKHHLLYTNGLLKNACGLCAIYRLIQMGICSAKIVGRVDRSDGVSADISLVQRNIQIALSSHSEEEFLKNMEIPFRRQAMCGLSCYYPEVRF